MIPADRFLLRKFKKVEVFAKFTERKTYKRKRVPTVLAKFVWEIPNSIYLIQPGTQTVVLAVVLPD